MRDTIRQALRDVTDLYGEAVFDSPNKFKNSLGDALGNRGIANGEAKRLRSLLGIAVINMQSYARLKTALAGNDAFIVGNLVSEMDRDYDVKRESAQAVIECIAELIGYAPQIPSAAAAAVVYDIINFAGCDWLTLERREDRVLLLCREIWDLRPYHKPGGLVTWANCTLRDELYTDFYTALPQADRERIIKTPAVNRRNAWYGTDAGGDTEDFVFILSIEEADKYFGDSGDYAQKRRKYLCSGGRTPESDGYAVSNEYDKDRAALYKGAAARQWLRTPGYIPTYAAGITPDGAVDCVGYYAGGANIGARPAMWVKA